jgi:hypothetical protein
MVGLDLRRFVINTHLTLSETIHSTAKTTLFFRRGTAGLYNTNVTALLTACGRMVDSANVVTGSNFRARKYNKPRGRSPRNFVPVTIFARPRTSDTGC